MNSWGFNLSMEGTSLTFYTCWGFETEQDALDEAARQIGSTKGIVVSTYQRWIDID